MPMRRDAYPLEVHLPDGTRARVRIVHVVEVNDKGEETLTQLAQYPPEYERRDGTTVPIDVMIPDDLAATGWYWSGSFLVRPNSDAPDAHGIAISTGTFGVPGYPTTERGTCFDSARRFNALRDEVLTARKAKPAKKPKRAKAAPAVELELAAEQMEFAL